MRGIICEQTDHFKLVDDLPEPACGPGEAIVRIRRIGICGTDLHAYKGNQPYFTYPRILGHELAGVVEYAPSDPAELRAGDQVCVIPYMHCGVCIACRSGKTNCCTSMQVLGVHIDGGMRERIALPVTHLLQTDGLTLDQSAVLEPLAIGAHAVRRSPIQPNDTVLVIGAGPIGLGVMVFAKLAGARVIAMDINEERLAFCREWAQVNHTVDATKQPKERVSEITEGDYPIIVFDATGNARSMEQSFNYVANGGSLVYVGLAKADISFHNPEFHKREMTLMGSRNATKEDFLHVLEAVRKGSIDVESYITHRSSFETMMEAFDDWLRPESKVIKAMVEL
ncbi:zinc-binding alcohol dehydrogenase family protein [Paenibacillus hexagrammi]|uniref:Zinc-binding alcohol dehydrogenase family protein n=1 Tax=Paenibacillus hexagrammi TaxID=2908839 RepID=A0ABY3SGP3_9BACL|nr:zinc-binding alcohol dehydrogenase family protein [Paenibacillus sp. YPD9-1]UJF32376.1 zinc-binding alcohol dehydrogenase family protein [Paenibacillus sp. YPD9-1]